MLIENDPCRAFMPYPPVAVEGASTGPLAGLTFGVKDLFDVKGYRTGCGNPIKLAESGVALKNAPAVQALLDAGARFVGKTHTEELAWSLYGTNVHFGTPLNPAAPERVPGGSSSGSASAVAGGLCDVALGSDTGGSVRGPASFCGLYGLRPTQGAISLGGCMALAESLDTCGFFARDAGAMLKLGQVLIPSAGSKAHRPLLAADLFARLPAATRAALQPTLEKILARSGEARAVTVYSQPIDPIYAAFRHIQASEVFAVHGAWLDRTQAPLGPAIAGRFAFARTVTAEQLREGRIVREAFTVAMRALLGDDGLLIAPVMPGPAPLLAASEEALDSYRHAAMAYLQVAGMAGLPQLVIPAGLVEGAPVGLSLIGSPGSDLSLLAFAAGLAGR